MYWLGTLHLDSRFLLWLPLLDLCLAELSNGEYPWTYDNDLFGGPDFWGLMHKQWRMCKAGKLQSPINIDPEKLVFDPGLGKLLVSGQQLDASLWNTGQFPLLTVNTSGGGNGGGDPKEEAKAGKQHSAAAAGGHQIVTFSGGPAFPYTYQFQQMLFHFGDIRKGERGSEHTIDRVRYPAEVQLLAFNSDLYENFTQAQSQPKGLLAIGLIVDIGNKTNPELKRLSHAAPSIKHRNQMVRVQHFQPAALLPGTEHFVSYEGSLTFPGCFETVTWVLYNSPIYINTEHLAIWAELVQSEKPALDKDKDKSGQQHQQQQQRGETAPPVPLTSNYRPLKANNGRLVRTNINVKLKSPGPAENGGNCPSNVYVDMGYQSNPKRAEASSSSSLSPSSASRKQHRQHSKGIGSSHEQYKYQLGGISTGGG